MYFFLILSSFLFGVAASAQQQACAGLPTKSAVPVGGTSQIPNQAAITAAINSPEMAAKKLKFEQQKAKLDADPNAQAQRAANQQRLSAAVNTPEFQKLKLQVANQIAVAQSSSSF